MQSVGPLQATGRGITKMGGSQDKETWKPRDFEPLGSIATNHEAELLRGKTFKVGLRDIGSGECPEEAILRNPRLLSSLVWHIALPYGRFSTSKGDTVSWPCATARKKSWGAAKKSSYVYFRRFILQSTMN